MVQGKHGTVTKQRLSISLNKDVLARLDSYVKANQKVRSLVIEKAVTDLLDGLKRK